MKLVMVTKDYWTIKSGIDILNTRTILWKTKINSCKAVMNTILWQVDVKS